jgi:hypothetical protein
MHGRLTACCKNNDISMKGFGSAARKLTSCDTVSAEVIFPSVSIFDHQREEPGDSLEKDHPSSAHPHTCKRHYLPTLACAPQRRV